MNRDPEATPPGPVEAPGGLLVPPCGGRLVDLLVPAEEREALAARAAGLPSLQLSERAAADLELLATGAFSPLDRFMGRRDHERVLHEMRLAGGQLFAIPVTLPVDPQPALELDGEVALRDGRNELLGVMRVEEIYEWDAREAARQVAGTLDARHPLVAEMARWGRLNLSGPLRVLRLPRRLDFRELRLPPAATRERLARAGRAAVVAVQVSHALHRLHEERIKRVVERVDGALLLQPVVGLLRPGDADHYTRIRTYRALASRHREPERIVLALLPLAPRMAGPRSALWHALVSRNHGANCLVVGRDHASPGADSQGRPFYDQGAARELVERHQDELGVRALPLPELVYLPEEGRYEVPSRVPPGARTATLSGSEAYRDYLDRGRPLPDWFARPEVAEILAEAHPPRHRQGVCVWFTGLSGAGKSTTAEVVTLRLLEYGRQVTLLDGDVVRTHLSRGLGFSKEDRDTNILRIGFVAAEIVRHGGVVVCAAVSPYRAARNEVRAMVGAERFVEIYVDTPLEVCEARDTKGMYARARRGEVKGFTGIDDPYEPPESPEITLDTVRHSPEDNARRILEHLLGQGFLRDPVAPQAGAGPSAR